MFEGSKVKVIPDVVLSRGRLLVEGDQFHGKAWTGKLLKTGQLIIPYEVQACWLNKVGYLRASSEKWTKGKFLF